MMAESKERLSTPSAETLALAGLSDEAKPLLGEDATPVGRIQKLAAAGLFPDAIKYLAHSLDARSCIAWALACARQLPAADRTPAELDALLAVEKWLAEPTDANRRASQFASEAAELSSPPGCIAMAVFFAEGSIAPVGMNPVAAPPQIAQKIASAGTILAVVEQPEKASERYQQCVRLGLQAAA